MHVLITADTLGGVWTYARELVMGLARHGVQVTLVSFGEIPTPAQSAWLDGLPGVDFRPTAFRLEWMQDSRADLETSAEYLAAIVGEVKPDLLHLNQYFYGDLPVELPRLVVAHSDVVTWWVAVHGQTPEDNDWIRGYRQIVSRGLSRATVVVAPSRSMLAQLALHYPLPQRASVIYNGRSPALFNPHLTKESYLVAVGRLWDAAKQVHLLAEGELPLTACIVGSEIHPDEAHRAAVRVHAASHLEFMGPQTEAQLCRLLGRASLYAATSRYEPFGLAPLEAALSRCAIIANDIPTFHEIWGETAYYFHRDDAASLARAIQRLHADRELRLTYANLAYHRARQRFSAARMVDDYLSLYQQLVPAGVAAA